jgi:hypothetical protein
MLGKVLKTTMPPPPRGPERDVTRVALGLAIANRDEKSRSFDAARAAASRAALIVEAAEAKHHSAKQELVAWRAGQVERLHAEAHTGAATTLIGKPAREVRAAAEDAADEIESAKSVLTDCMASVADAKDGLQYAQLGVERAVAPVFVGALDGLLAEAAALREQLDGKHALLSWVERLLLPGDPARQRIASALPPLPPGAPGYRSIQAPAAWLAALDALMVDPDAALP